MHRELEEFDWVGTIGELSEAARLQSDRNRPDFDYDERDDSRWLWELAVSGCRR